MIQIEICAYSVASALAAEQCGADRIEFCSGAHEGGMTPSHGAIAYVREHLGIKMHVIIRPREGAFVYSEAELHVMRRDIEFCRHIGVDGVVIGVLTGDDAVDLDRMRELVRLAQPMTVTFHRAFDLVEDPIQALEDVISAGCSRLLTSGLQPSALTGAPLIRKLVERSAARISIMPGGGVRADNLAELARLTGAKEFHSSARMRSAAPLVSGNAVAAGFGDASQLEADQHEMRRLVQAARAIEA